MEIERVEESRQEVKLGLKSGEEVSTKLLVVAEGSGSNLAEQIGINRNGWLHNQRALVTNLTRLDLMNNQK